MTRWLNLLSSKSNIKHSNECQSLVLSTSFFSIQLVSNLSLFSLTEIKPQDIQMFDLAASFLGMFNHVQSSGIVFIEFNHFLF